MPVPVPATPDPASNPPVRQNAGKAWDEICRMMGLPSFPGRELADLPPWPEEDAAAFERVINEAFEQVDEVKKLPL